MELPGTRRLLQRPEVRIQAVAVQIEPQPRAGGGDLGEFIGPIAHVVRDGAVDGSRPARIP
jgi:hypothetical protein